MVNNYRITALSGDNSEVKQQDSEKPCFYANANSGTASSLSLLSELEQNWSIVLVATLRWASDCII